MKIFLTGHNGFIGKHLHPKLIEKGHDVITELRYFDAEQFDVVIHLAAVTHIRTEFDPRLFESNITLSKKIMSSPFRTLYASSCSAKYLTNPYAYTKRYCEWLGEKHGNALGLRFHNVYGTGNNKGIVWHLLNQPDGASVDIKGASLVRDYIHVGDVVAEIIKQINPFRRIAQSCKTGKCKPSIYPTLEKNIGVIDVGTGVGTRTVDLVQLFEEVSGRHFNIKTNEDWGGGNEPTSMVSNNPVPAMSLKDGLIKILNENSNTGSKL